MTKEDLLNKYSPYDLETIHNFIEDYIDYLKENEPNAVNSIAALENGLVEIPSDLIDI